jgi:hypothetical protein
MFIERVFGVGDARQSTGMDRYDMMRGMGS